MPDLSHVMYFDGWCGLCDRLVTFLAARDRRGILRFAPLQGETARAALPPEMQAAGDPDAVVFVDAAGTHQRSTAILRALAAMGGPWRLAAVFLLVPEVARDAIYDFVARRRFRWFGRRESCRLPVPEDQGRFLP